MPRAQARPPDTAAPHQSRDAGTLGTPLFDAQRAAVHRVLAEIGTPAHIGRSVVEVWNKIDAVQEDAVRRDELRRRLFEAQQRRAAWGQEGGGMDEDEGGDSSSWSSSSSFPPLVVPVSARTGEGLADLKAAIAERLVAGGHEVAREEGRR